MKINVDSSQCTGCRSCEIYCSWANFGEINPKKSALRISAEFPAPGRYTVVMCNQCGNCVDVCPEKALMWQGDVVVIDKRLCTGCGLCSESCPTSAIFTHKDAAMPIKCTACGECLGVCAKGAITVEKGGFTG